MTRLAEIEGHIVSMGELRDVVGGMRSLAGMRVQEAQRALPGIRRYADAMADAIGDALLLMPEPVLTPAIRPRRALVLFTAEHGFAGGFNQALIDSPDAAASANDALFVLGSRGAAMAQERGRPAAWARPMATRVASAPDAVRPLTVELYRRIARNEFSRVEAVFARTGQGRSTTVVRRTVLPLDVGSLARKRLGQAPFHNLPAPALLEKLMAEYVFALLVEAAIESIASENAARFTAMDSAHDNVTKKLDQLRGSAQLARQSEITDELLDIVTGAEALTERQD
jgi:F-type H+-transporting ATPase subunit gamma